jgi:hypothetical protein
MGLFELIADNPDEVIMLDDRGAILRSEVALQILLSALEHSTNRDRSRVVKYRLQGEERRATFSGGIVCLSNQSCPTYRRLAEIHRRIVT